MTSAPVTSHVGYILKQAQHGLRSRMDQSLRALALSTAQYAILVALHEVKVASGAELARRCFVTPQTVTGLVGGLEGSGLIIRSASSRHGRVIEARLTPRGRDVLRRANAIVFAIEENMLSDLSKSERAMLGRMLRLCASRLGMGSSGMDGN